MFRMMTWQREAQRVINLPLIYLLVVEQNAISKGHGTLFPRARITKYSSWYEVILDKNILYSDISDSIISLQWGIKWKWTVINYISFYEFIAVIISS